MISESPSQKKPQKGARGFGFGGRALRCLADSESPSQNKKRTRYGGDVGRADRYAGD
jgi:hypothetical protein